MNEEKENKIIMILAYDNLLESTLNFPIKTYIIPYDINENFKLPESIKKIKIKEMILESKKIIERDMMTIYIGEEIKIKDLIKTDKKILIEKDFIKKLNLKQNYLQKRILVEIKDNQIIVKKVLNENETVISTLESMETFIKKLKESILSYCKKHTLSMKKYL